MRIYLVRHPQPEVGAGICYGRTDIGVLPGMLEKVLPGLLAALPRQAPLYTSPLSRCADLAAALANALGDTLPVHDPRLMELDFGAWEMQEWPAISRAEIDAWAANLTGYRPGGGESVRQMAIRVLAFYKDILSRQHEQAIVVCHAGTIRLLLACSGSATPADMAEAAARQPHAIPYGHMISIDC